MRIFLSPVLLVVALFIACADSSPTENRSGPAPAPRVVSLSISPDTGTLRPGEALQLSATPKDSSGSVLTGREVVWSSTDTTKARVSGTGLVTGVAAGAVTITAVVEGSSARAQIVLLNRRPNFILIVTDDQALSDFDFMPRLREVLQRRGTTFSHFFVTTPNCCPSRASIFRGQYTHNHQVYNNGPPQAGGFGRFHNLGHEKSTIATWLRDAGYRTVLLGKYLNIFPGGVTSNSYVPPGWEEWYASIQGSEFNFFGYTLSENGRPRLYGYRPEDYQTDVLSHKATDFIRRASRDGKPFFMYIGPYAPHEPATPAPRHQGMFADVTAPRPPSFNEEDVSDKPLTIRQLPILDAAAVRRLDELYRNRLRSLQAVDDMVGALVDTLAAAGALENTYIFFTSDNGFHMGQHRLAPSKKHPYEEDIRVGMVVRGPGVPAGRVEEQFGLTIDLAPTLAALAGVPVPHFVDGRSLVPLLMGQRPTVWRQALLAEVWTSGIPASLAWDAVRTRDYTYVERGPEREFYHLPSDPDQLESLHGKADQALIDGHARRLAALRSCAGASCRAAEEQP